LHGMPSGSATADMDQMLVEIERGYSTDRG
jgi:hypothetical protein